MKIIKNISLVVLTVLLIGCGSNTSTTSDTKEINGFWQDIEADEMIEIKDNNLYRYQYNKEKVHDAGGECYSSYQIATIESNATEPAILKYLYYQDRFKYTGSINIIKQKNELKFLKKYEEGPYSKNEVVNHYEKLELSDADIDMCNYADRTGGVTEKSQLKGLWKIANDFKFEPSNEKVEYWLISDNAQVRSLVYDQKKQCYASIYSPLYYYFFVPNVYNDGRFNLVYNVGTSPGTASYRVVLASINDDILTFFGFDNNDTSSLIKENDESIKLCN